MSICRAFDVCKSIRKPIAAKDIAADRRTALIGRVVATPLQSDPQDHRLPRAANDARSNAMPEHRTEFDLRSLGAKIDRDLGAQGL
jgi:hypothetical protein